MRSALQLFAIGYVIQAIFDEDSLWLTAALIVVMVVFGAYTARARARKVPGAFVPLLIALALAAVATLGLVLALGIFEADPAVPGPGGRHGDRQRDDRGGRRAEPARRRRRGAAPGRSRPRSRSARAGSEAVAPIVRRSVRSGMIALVDSTKTTGLIFFPGTMVGMLLAGADPTDAVRLQLILLWVLLGSVAISSLVATGLAYRNFFTAGPSAPRAARAVSGGGPTRFPPVTRIFSGIQPTGRKHLGNYIGAIRQYVEGQDRGESIYCVVDLHALTVAYDPAELRERLYDTTAILLAAGLDPSRCILFRQSDVHEHTELSWLLGAVTAHGDLNRMHQFKEKSEQQRELVSAGLFFYPVLMAADVLAHRATEVPVGDDQRQHIELMRDIAERFNARFGEVLVVPEGRFPEVGARIMNLQDPESRMSTTYGPEQGTVYILDPPDDGREEGAERGDGLGVGGQARRRTRRGSRT